MGPTLSYWKPAKKKGATHDPFTKNKAPYDPLLGELEYYRVSVYQNSTACYFTVSNVKIESKANNF